MVGIVGVAKSEWHRLPIVLLFNPILQTNGIAHDAHPSLLTLTGLN
jgi:hypothetical protein